jgi:hypothetical protein
MSYTTRRVEMYRARPVTVTPSNPSSTRTQRRVAQRNRVDKVYVQINTALVAARAKGQHRTVRHLTIALGSVSDALDILGEQTTNRKGR